MFPETTLIRFRFDDFLKLSSMIDSDYQFDRNGLEWKIRLYPMGEGVSDEIVAVHENTVDRWISLFLYPQKGTNEDLDWEWKYSMILRDGSGKVAHEKTSHPMVSQANGYKKFIKRSTLLDESKNILNNGALVVDVLLQVKPFASKLYEPPNPIVENTLALLESGEDSNIVFSVDNHLIKAHSQILRANATLLADFCKMKSTKENDIILIEGTNVEVFKLLLRYIYGGTVVDSKFLLRHAKEIIVASNKYGVVGLKIAVENIIVELRAIGLKNAADYFVFADANTCPLLREYAMSYIMSRPDDVFNSEHSKCLNEAPELLQDLLIERTNIDRGERSVFELRKELGIRRLNVDGSKRMLTSRLADWNKRQKTK